MSLAQTLSTYIAINILLTVAFILLSLWSIVADRLKIHTGASVQLKLHYSMIIAICIISCFYPFLPLSEIFSPAIKQWSAQSMTRFSEQYTVSDQSGYLAIPSVNGNLTLNAAGIEWAFIAVAVFVILLGLMRLFFDLRSLLRIRQKSFAIRKYGTVTLLLNDEIQVPFSFWVPGRADVFIPSSFLYNIKNFKMAVAHELQHHRQLDTQWVYALWAIKIICVANPFAYLWSRWISELQEFACDEALIDQNKVESLQYARCLVEVAETANNQRYVPACATGLMFLIERNLLKRRIDKMIQKSNYKIKRSISLPIGISIITLLMSAAYAANGIVQDRRVSMSEAEKLASKVQAGKFPIQVNDLVLKQLNRYIGTPEGREHMRNSLQRMTHYRPFIEKKISEYDVPSDLIAIPIVESGYQNLEQKPKKGWGAGIWMFIQSTARNFGLRVDDQVDERLDSQLLTDAAMRLLKADALRFKDWHLSVLAFNIGSNRVQEAIKLTGSRDAWALVRAGYENDKEYLAKVMAAIIIMHNPKTVL